MSLLYNIRVYESIHAFQFLGGKQPNNVLSHTWFLPAGMAVGYFVGEQPGPGCATLIKFCSPHCMQHYVQNSSSNIEMVLSTIHIIPAACYIYTYLFGAKNFELSSTLNIE